MEFSKVNSAFHELKKSAFLLRSQKVIHRKKRLRKMERWIMDHRADIRDALYRDMQKSARETDLSETYPVLTELRETIRNLNAWTEPHPLNTPLTYLGTSASVYYEPKGVCLIISPWNYPFNLSLGPVVSAVAAGNTFMLKPSEFTPHSAALIRSMISEVFPPDTGLVIEGDASVSQELLKLPFDHIFFTGSPAVGKLVMEAAAKNLASVTLELGGKSPAIVDETADVKDAAIKIAWGKWLNAGQTCVAPDYVWVHEAVADPFLAELEKQARIRFREQDYTSIINQKHFDRLRKLVSDARAKGARMAFGKPPDEDRNRMYPTVFVGVREDALLMQEEIFGPILPVNTYKNPDEVIAFINKLPKPLALYLFTKSRRNQKQVIRQTSAGTMVINDCVLQFTHPTLPFGGVNHSGIGKSHSRFGFLAFSNEKAILKQKIGFTMARSLYPPYKEMKNKIIDFLLKYF